MHRFETLTALALLFLGGCSEVASPGERRWTAKEDEEFARFEAKVRALGGRVGEFEGVYTPYIEGSGFSFCTAEECPDAEQVECHPVFSEEAAKTLDGLLGDAQIHMFASGRTSAEIGGYGHMSEQLCEIEIDRVREPRLMKNLLVRSKKYPLLARDDEPVEPAKR
jgi:hypothetical protein